MQVFCDFDGTISKADVTDLVLERFALPEWRDIETQWESGEINSSECMRGQVRLIRASRQQLDAFLDTIDIDPYFADFQRYCKAHALPLTVLSDGVDYFIQRILGTHGIGNLTVRTNHLVGAKAGEDAVFDLVFPEASPQCFAASGVCKCRIVAGAPSDHVYIGDGRSDFCVAHDATLVFAKDKLAVYSREHRIPYIEFRDFRDVRTAVDEILSSRHYTLTQFASLRSA